MPLRRKILYYYKNTTCVFFFLKLVLTVLYKKTNIIFKVLAFKNSVPMRYVFGVLTLKYRAKLNKKNSVQNYSGNSSFIHSLFIYQKIGNVYLKKWINTKEASKRIIEIV